ncbi:type II toxin-antitoxin system VapC family toxin [Gloeobacter violaceus]|uniref:Gll2024 protein n=1 Tax=Gloeobacter violaceus (strain ATCC 29082 / PCC 7421) TaxID=251221 RepID=Q7NJ08_GLOVI|nr:type II toxin-antitoxin system VapC family toxin [Gloeobacter violaceus]BAC89965.1 gll2024 [Gloeobacter violaceus PCC 7421]
MKHLLDSHTLLWYTLGEVQLSSTASRLILDLDNEAFISPASFWEIAIKISINKLTLHQPYKDFMDGCLNQYGFTILPITPRHTGALTTMPFHHKDPFDRLLVAQALVEDIPLVSADVVFDQYGIKRIW